MKKWKDLFGKDIQPGQLIVYAAMRGATPILHEAAVTKVTETAIHFSRPHDLFYEAREDSSWKPDGRPLPRSNRYLKHSDRCVVMDGTPEEFWAEREAEWRTSAA